MYDFSELSALIVAELSDPNFERRMHGSKSTHSAGCHGPMCRKALKDKANLRRRRRGAPSIPRTPESIAVDQFIQQVIDAHQEVKKGA